MINNETILCLKKETNKKLQHIFASIEQLSNQLTQNYTVFYNVKVLSHPPTLTHLLVLLPHLRTQTHTYPSLPTPPHELQDEATISSTLFHTAETISLVFVFPPSTWWLWSFYTSLVKASNRKSRTGLKFELSFPDWNSSPMPPWRPPRPRDSFFKISDPYKSELPIPSEVYTRISKPENCPYPL